MSAEESELDQLLGAYALDAVSDEERLRVEQYLEINPRARHEVHEHREVAAVLAWTGATAPEGLWGRIAASLEGSAPEPTGELAAVLASPGRVSDQVQAIRSADSRRSRVIAWLGGVAAAAAAVAAIVVVLVSDDESRSALDSAVAAARSDDDSSLVRLVRDDGSVGAEAIIDVRGQGYLVGDDLPALGADRTYQLWGVIGDDVISLGVLGNDPGTELFSADAPVTALAVTIERAGGVVSDGNPVGAYVGALT